MVFHGSKEWKSEDKKRNQKTETENKKMQDFLFCFSQMLGAQQIV